MFLLTYSFFVGGIKMLYKDKVVIVTGGSKGIGKAVTEAYIEEGAIVVNADIFEPEYEANESHYIKTDVSQENSIVEMINNVITRYKRIDILINNAGISLWHSPFDLSVDEWDKIINTNLRSVFISSREAGKIMKEQGGGSIVNISSTRSIMSEPNTEAYAASKGGINALTHALAASFSEYKIQVNCISPGWIENGDIMKLRKEDHSQHFSQRVGVPKDIARACLFLTNPLNNFISGTNLVIDGGMTRKMIYEH